MGDIRYHTLIFTERNRQRPTRITILPARRSPVLPLVVLGLILLATGCATGRITGDSYVDEFKGFRMPLPPRDWQPVPVEGADIAFRRTGGAGTMGVHADCRDPEAGPLRAVARHLFFGLRALRILEQQPLSVDRTEALRTVIIGELRGEPVQVESVEIRRPGCLYDLILTAPPAEFAADRPAFERLVGGWTLLPRRP